SGRQKAHPPRSNLARTSTGWPGVVIASRPVASMADAVAGIISAGAAVSRARTTTRRTMVVELRTRPQRTRGATLQVEATQGPRLSRPKRLTQEVEMRPDRVSSDDPTPGVAAPVAEPEVRVRHAPRYK